MKVRLLSPMFNTDHGGRLPEGAVVDVPDAVAEHWISKLHIARKASGSVKTYAEEKRERAAAEAEETGQVAPFGYPEDDEEDAEEDAAPPPEKPAPPTTATAKK